MSNVSMSGNVVAKVRGNNIPIIFDGNVVELTINKFSVLYECYKLKKSFMSTKFESELKKSIIITIKSNNFFISLITRFLKFS